MKTLSQETQTKWNDREWGANQLVGVHCLSLNCLQLYRLAPLPMGTHPPFVPMTSISYGSSPLSYYREIWHTTLFTLNGMVFFSSFFFYNLPKGVMYQVRAHTHTRRKTAHLIGKRARTREKKSHTSRKESPYIRKEVAYPEFEP